MYNNLKSISYLRVIPSQANYFLCEVLSPMTSSQLAGELVRQNILIKDCYSKKGIHANYVRVAIRSENENNLLLKSLQKITL